MTRRLWIGAVVLAAILGAVASPQMSGPNAENVRSDAASLVSHIPIYIQGNAGFTNASGVVAGSGTAADPYIIGGWEIAAGGENAIDIFSTSAYFVIENVLVRNGSVGILLRNVVHGGIQAVTSKWNTVGLSFNASSQVSVASTVVSDNVKLGVSVQNSTDVTLSSDTVQVTSGVYSLDANGGIAVANSSRIEISSTNVWNSGVWFTPAPGIRVKDSNAVTLDADVVAGNIGAGVVLSNVDSTAVVSSQIVHNWGRGVRVDSGSVNVTIAQNNISENYYNSGIEAYDSSVAVEGNLLSKNRDDGVYLYGVTHGVLSGNSIPILAAGDPTNNGIHAVSSKNLLVENNTILLANNLGGLFEGCTNVTLLGNSFGSFTAYEFAGYAGGLSIQSGSQYTVIRNSMRSSSKSLVFQGTKNTIFHHNNVGPGPSISGGGNNTWNDVYPSGGNFWSDYSGVDNCSGPLQNDCTGGDGIGDTPFTSGNAMDHYPLMNVVSLVNRPPVLSSLSVSPPLAMVGETVTFSAFGQDPDKDSLVYAFSFGDGGTATGTASGAGTTIVGEHAYAALGAYAVSLSVDDGHGGKAWANATIPITEPGQLRVTTSIDIHPSSGVPAKIIIDAIPRDEWGLNWVPIASGSHTISFTDVPGLQRPSDVTVTVNQGATTTVNGVFTALGWLRVITTPAVPGTIFVDGIRRDDWGLWTALPPGDHTVSFGAVQGYTRPGPIAVSIQAEQLATVTGSYVYDGISPGPDPSTYGYLRVTTIRNDTVGGVPSQILVDGVLRESWGLNWLKMPPGTYTVSFTDVPGLGTPAPRAITVVAGQTTQVVGYFEAFGFLHVSTNPAVPGTIFVDGVARDAWGMWQAVPEGTYLVSFGAVSGFVAPPAQVVSVLPGQTATVVGTYT